MIDSTQLGYPDGPVGNETHAQQLDDRIGQDHALPEPAAYETLTEHMPTSPLDLATVAVSMQGSVDHFDAVGLATAFTNRIEQAAMDAGICDIEPAGMENAGPEPD